MKKKITAGTKEWASSNVNIAFGCSHDCRYCYAKRMAIRFGRKTADNWKYVDINEKAVKKSYKKRHGRIMFPSSHDIVPVIVPEATMVLLKLLQAGNEVLITTKPHFWIVRHLCSQLFDFRDQIQFRFTITSMDDETLRFWEPGAPRFEERLRALIYAYNADFKTSISIEPLLNPNPLPLIRQLEPYVTESIWIGIMNYLPNVERLSTEERPWYDQIRNVNRPDHILRLVKTLKDRRLIRWKDSIQKIIDCDRSSDSSQQLTLSSISSPGGIA